MESSPVKPVRYPRSAGVVSRMLSSLRARIALRTAWWRTFRYDLARVTATGISILLLQRLFSHHRPEQYRRGARTVNGWRLGDGCFEDDRLAGKLWFMRWLKRTALVMLLALFALACAFGFGITPGDAQRMIAFDRAVER